MAAPYFTFLQLTTWVLHSTQKALSPGEIWEEAEKLGFSKHIRSHGLTPASTIGAQIYVHVRDEQDNAWILQTSHRPTRFQIIPGKAPIAELQANLDASTKRLSQEQVASQSAPLLDPQDDESAEIDHTPKKSRKFSFIERETHPFLSRFAFDKLSAYTKTIYHEVSKRGSYGQWLHPDLVGFRFPFQKCNQDLVKLVGGPAQVMTTFSFEVKRDLHLGNLRESFFQAVSNSSWANEAYLVASVIDDRTSFMDELRRLSNSFGIGVIEMDLDDPEATQIILPAQLRVEIDFEAANKLAKENPDFERFLRNVQIDVSSGHPHPSEYDNVLKLEELTALKKTWDARLRSYNAAVLPKSDVVTGNGGQLPPAIG